MRVLWVSGRLIGPAASIINSDYQGTSGGWIQTEYDDLNKTDIEMFYLAGVKSAHSVKKKDNVYCVQLPKVSNGINAPRSLVSEIDRIVNEIAPDVIQLWGTETCLQEAVSKVAPTIPKVVFIQGLIGMHDRYRGGYMDRTDKSYGRSISIPKKIEIEIRRIAFKRQIVIEQSILKRCKNVIVDNDYSRAYCYSVSKNIRFFNRQLNANGCFKSKSWDITSAVKYSLFTVYGGSPDKGLHQLLKALVLVKREIHDIKLRVPGPFKLDKNGVMIRENASSYEKWISSFIQKNDLVGNVEFIGSKTQSEMAEEAMKANVFVNPSCMEVHALSLREAMTVGVPCISSLCGSVSEYLHSGENGILYRYEEHEVLAYNIIKLFKDDNLAIRLGRNARNDMLSATESNVSIPLEEIYKEIVK
ncbi:MAG: glycosyltransferase family 4 protein [Eubacteriales bacterium]|nr:glycosyltransferase family 4 protein [Eubacteriales bacterium]